MADQSPRAPGGHLQIASLSCRLSCRTANVLVKRHGEDAPLYAAMRTDAMLESGDLDGYAVWRRVLKAVEELLSKERPDDATLQ